MTWEQINTKLNSINKSEIYNSTLYIMDVASQRVDNSICAVMETGLPYGGK